MHAKLAHPKLNRNFKPQESGTFDLGTAAHAMLFEGGAGIIKIDPREFPAKNGNIPEGWTNDAIRAARDAARAEGKTPVLAKQYEEIERMFSAARVALLRCTDIPGLSLIDEGKKEATIIWQESNGIWCRVRPDCLAHDASIVLDYKTTTDAAPGVFGRQISRMGYHLQDAFYRRGVRALTGRDPAFVFLAQENEAPYACSFHAVDPSLATIADAEVERCIRLWGECLSRDSWPDYGTRIHWVSASNWQMIEHEETEAQGHPYDPAKLWPANERIAA
jgi:hypothetical protein